MLCRFMKQRLEAEAYSADKVFKGKSTTANLHPYSSVLTAPKHLKQNPFFLDLMLRRLLLRAAMLKLAAKESALLDDDDFKKILSEKVDAYPDWLFAGGKLDPKDAGVLSEDDVIGLKAREHVGQSEQN